MDAHTTADSSVLGEDDFRAEVGRLKDEGKKALDSGDHKKALQLYGRAVGMIKESPHKMTQDLAMLYNNMAIIYSKCENYDIAITMAKESINVDPNFDKAYWRLGTILNKQGSYLKACETMLQGAHCSTTPMLFVCEICKMLTEMNADSDRSVILGKIEPNLSEWWPKMVDNLIKSSSWDAIRLLVLGPPHLSVSKSSIRPEWRFADSFRDSDDTQIRVGFAMCYRATTAVLSSLVYSVRSRLLKKNEWATDLILALLLQGAQLSTLVAGDEETCYHVVIYLCCWTEKLGLLRYILSDEMHLQEARKAFNKEKRTLLHAVCLQFRNGTQKFGRQLLELLIKKGFNPMLEDKQGKKAQDYLSPGSSMAQLLTKSPSELKSFGNAKFKEGHYTEAIDFYSQAIDTLSSELKQRDQRWSVRQPTGEQHELAVLFGNRSECYMKLGDIEKALTDAQENVAHDKRWYKGYSRLGQAHSLKNELQFAAENFARAFNTLDKLASLAIKQDVLKNLVRVLARMQGYRPYLLKYTFS